MNSRFLVFVFIFLLLPVLSFGIQNPSVHAQVGIPGSELVLSSSVDNPVPNQKVTVTLHSYSFDINTSRVSWYVNGTQIQTGIGLTNLDIVAPQLGKKTSIRVTAIAPDGHSSSAVMDIGSGSIDLIMETDGYVPPLFPGKTNPVYQNSIKIVAIPHIANSAGIEYDPKTLVYQWKKDDKVLEDQSGYGKQALIVSSGLVPREFNISVEVYSRDGLARAQNIIGVTFESPFISFYMSDPLYGPLFNKALAPIVRIGSQKETSVLAVPFGFNKPTDGIGNLTYAWSINGTSRNELKSNESLVLRAPEGVAGSSHIELNIKNPDKILQGANNSFSAKFTANKKAGEDIVF